VTIFAENVVIHIIRFLHVLATAIQSIIFAIS